MPATITTRVRATEDAPARRGFHVRPLLGGLGIGLGYSVFALTVAVIVSAILAP